MGKMLISAWLAVASGKIGGRSLALEPLLPQQDVIVKKKDTLPRGHGRVGATFLPPLKEIEKKEAINSGENEQSSSDQDAIEPVAVQQFVAPLGDGNVGGGAPKTPKPVVKVEPAAPVEKIEEKEDKSGKGEQVPEINLADVEAKDPSQTQTVPCNDLTLQTQPACLLAGGSCVWKAPNCVDKDPDVNLGTAIMKALKPDFKTALESMDKDEAKNIIVANMNVVKATVTGWAKQGPEELKKMAEKVMGGYTVEDFKDPNKWGPIVKKLMAYDSEDTLVQFLADPETKKINYIAYGYFLHVGLWSGEAILTLLGFLLPKWVKWFLSLFFSGSAIGFLLTNGIAVWWGWSARYWLLAAVHAAVIIAQILTNFFAFGPLKIIAWLLNPVFELLGAFNIIFVCFVPLYHGGWLNPETAKSILTSMSAEAETAISDLIKKA